MTAASNARSRHADQVSFGKRLLLAAVAIGLAAAIWLPLVHLMFRAELPPPKEEAAPQPFADRLAARHLHLWGTPELRMREIAKMRAANAEWDFMGRCYLVWGLAERCVREPACKAENLAVMDRIIDQTLRTEREEGLYHFLMPYARNRPFVQQPARSQFLDGEIALMLAMRRLVEEKQEYQPLLAERVEMIVRRMQANPVMCAESYPDECWMFCNAVALAAIRIADYLDGTDHAAFFKQWVQIARGKLVDERTGLLISSFTLEGRPLDGPEGSSIWMVAHCLRLVDEPFAREQYERARKELGVRVCGFAYAREWPASWRGSTDVDSGPVVPVLGASAGSSGLAFVAARSFDDGEYFRALKTTIDFAGFPIERECRLKYGASNQVGDAVLLYAAVLGPAWKKVQEERPDE